MSIRRPPSFEWGSELDLTLSGLEAGLRVRDICTFEMATCDATDAAGAVLGRRDLSYFDQIPVRSNGRLIGVLERLGVGNDATGAVEGVMRPLDDSVLVEAELPLPRFLPLALKSPYYLVVDGSQIGGLVTRSDLLKLPVRVLAFAHVAHLESRMAAVIRHEVAGTGWLALLDDEGKRVQNKGRKLATDRLDPDLLELTFFSEKRQAVGHLLNLSDAEEADLKTIEQMRNDVAHGNDYGRSADQLEAFVRSVQNAANWIGRLDAHLTATGELSAASRTVRT